MATDPSVLGALRLIGPTNAKIQQGKPAVCSKRACRLQNTLSYLNGPRQHGNTFQGAQSCLCAKRCVVFAAIA